MTDALQKSSICVPYKKYNFSYVKPLITQCWTVHFCPKSKSTLICRNFFFGQGMLLWHSVWICLNNLNHKTDFRSKLKGQERIKMDLKPNRDKVLFALGVEVLLLLNLFLLRCECPYFFAFEQKSKKSEKEKHASWCFFVTIVNIPFDPMNILM